MKRLMLGGFALSVIVVSFAFLLPQFADYRQAWHVLSTLSWGWIAVLSGCALLDLLTFAPPWQVALPRLRFGPALAVTQASTAASLFTPAGSAVGIAISYQLLRRHGFNGANTSRAVSLTSLWNQLVNLAYPIVAVCLLAASGYQTAIVMPAAVLGAALLAVVVAGLILVATSDHLARWTGDLAARVVNRIGRIVHRAPVGWSGLSFERFRRDAIDLLRRRWLLLTAATVTNGLATFLTLTASLRALEVSASQVSLAEAFAAWALARLLTSIEFTPGGFGVFELSLTAALVSFGGPSARVVAAVLLYRALTVLPTLAIGLLVLATTGRQAHRQSATAR